MTVVCFISVTGCEIKEKNIDSFTVNSLETLNYGETKSYRINFDITKDKITAEDKKTGETIDLFREPFVQDAKICAIFVHNEWSYYLARVPFVEGIRIYGINMQNFGQKLIFNNIKDNHEDFFGVLLKERNVISDFYEKMNASLPVYCFFIKIGRAHV